MFYKNIDSYRVDMMKDGKLLRSESTKDTKVSCIEKEDLSAVYRFTAVSISV